MRILFAFTGGRGHVEPLLPLAEAARTAGHAVAFAGRPSVLSVLEERGFDGYATEPPGRRPERIPLQELDPEREARDFREAFADQLARQRAPRVAALCSEWRPDVVVCDETDFGAMVAAERLELPYASVVTLAAGTFAVPELVAEPLGRLRSEHGLPPDPGLAMLSRHLVLAPLPPRYRDPAFPLPPTARCFRPFDSAVARHDGAPRVYFTLGTVFNLESGDLFSRVLAGLGKLPVEVVATVGSEIDPAELGSLPPHVRVERFVPQAEILPRCSAVVSHGGSGSVLGALAHGLPQVLIPMGADQPLNAARCEELGLARVLDPVQATPQTVREAVTAVLTEPRYRAAAERLQHEFAALPGPEFAVNLLERLR
jgi:UDP:flavonoid glycosyltransferase YjiC (YdhE family)